MKNGGGDGPKIDRSKNSVISCKTWTILRIVGSNRNFIQPGNTSNMESGKRWPHFAIFHIGPLRTLGLCSSIQLAKYLHTYHISALKGNAWKCHEILLDMYFEILDDS